MEELPVHYPLLAIDTASDRKWVAVKRSADHLESGQCNDDASAALFRLVETALERSNTALAAIRSIVYCEGPGSMLGIRAAVMAIRAWEGIGLPGAANLFAFDALTMSRAILNTQGAIEAETLIVTDARRGAWNVLRGGDPANAIRIVENDDMERSPHRKLSPDSFPSWTATSAAMESFPYDLDAVFRDERFRAAIRPTPCAVPLALRDSAYRKWTPRIHAAPATEAKP